MTETDLFSNERVLAALRELRGKDDVAIEVPGTDIVLIPVRQPISTETTTLSVVYGNRFVYGFGVVCYNEPNEINLESLVSGFSDVDRVCPGTGGVDVAYFNTDEAICPFDLGGFCNLGPLVMTFTAKEKPTKLDMVLIGQHMCVSDAIGKDRLLKSESEIAATIPWPKAEAFVEEPDVFVDPGWKETIAKNTTVRIFADTSPMKRLDDPFTQSLHGIVGTVQRRGRFAMEFWFGDGSPMKVVGLRAFNPGGMFEIHGIYNSFERRTVLRGAKIDLAAFGPDDLFTQFEFGVVSKEKPLLVIFNNVTPPQAEAVLNMIFVIKPPDDAAV